MNHEDMLELRRNYSMSQKTTEFEKFSLGAPRNGNYDIAKDRHGLSKKGRGIVEDAKEDINQPHEDYSKEAWEI